MAIEVKNLTKYYNSTPAILDLSFNVQTGEILGFLGPNGAGKTTTMKIITCFMPPTSGIVEIDGYNIYDHSIEVRRKIGYLPETNPLYEDMNVLEFLIFSAELQGLKQPYLNKRLKEIIEVCGIGNVRHKDINELSKGYKQRVGLAQAIIHDPDVLILDEPTSGLDPNQIVEIRNLIKRLGSSKTVVLSTHILSEVQATCDRVIIVNNGQIAADGTLEQLQDSAHGRELITLELKAELVDPLQDIVPKFNQIASVDSVEFIKSDGNYHKFAVSSPKGSDLREAISNLALSEKWVILEMNREVVSLEQVFHNLTTSGNTIENFFAKKDSNLYIPNNDVVTPKAPTIDEPNSIETRTIVNEFNPPPADENNNQVDEDPYAKYKP